MTKSVADQIKDIAIQKNHIVEMMFYPTAWKNAVHSNRSWHLEAFPPSDRKKIPKKSGVYAFVVQPKVFDFVHSSGLFYVGKATCLYERIASYIAEFEKDLNNTTRPSIWVMINQWNGHLDYYYTTTKDIDEAGDLEAEMLKAFMPHFNKQFPAEISKTMRAF